MGWIDFYDEWDGRWLGSAPVPSPEDQDASFRLDSGSAAIPHPSTPQPLSPTVPSLENLGLPYSRKAADVTFAYSHAPQRYVRNTGIDMSMIWC